MTDEQIAAEIPDGVGRRGQGQLLARHHLAVGDPAGKRGADAGVLVLDGQLQGLLTSLPQPEQQALQAALR